VKKKLKAAVVGVGHLGKEHARIYRDLADVELTSIVDIDKEKAQKYAKEYRCRASYNVKDMPGDIDLASVAVPTVSHREITEYLLKRGVNVLIEKPMAANLEEARSMLRAARSARRILQVGHVERFNPVIAALEEKELSPKFIECHRLSPFTFRSADIGVVFDLMIHDLDIILHLAGSPIKRLDACGVAVIGEHEDIANARILFKNGCVANITASRVSFVRMRKLRVFSDDAYFSLDFMKKEGLMYRKSAKLSSEVVRRSIAKAKAHEKLKGLAFEDLLEVQKMKIDDYEPLYREIESFVHCVWTGEKPTVSGTEGTRAIQAAERVLKAIEGHTWD
jgi:predicted dehydrogenase